jgi:hypothetical protein
VTPLPPAAIFTNDAAPAASFLQITFQPFCCKMLDTVQRASFHTLQITLFLLMLASLSGLSGFLDEDIAKVEANDLKLAVMIIIVVVNVLLVLLFLYCLWREGLRLLKHTIAKDKDGPLTAKDVYKYVSQSVFTCGREGKSSSGTAQKVGKEVSNSGQLVAQSTDV